jgi:hypothetical protein
MSFVTFLRVFATKRLLQTRLSSVRPSVGLSQHKIAYGNRYRALSAVVGKVLTSRGAKGHFGGPRIEAHGGFFFQYKSCTEPRISV